MGRTGRNIFDIQYVADEVKHCPYHMGGFGGTLKSPLSTVCQNFKWWQFNSKFRETPRGRDHLKENVCWVFLPPQFFDNFSDFFWQFLFFFLTSNRPKNSCLLYGTQSKCPNLLCAHTHTHTNPVMGTKSLDANLIILCRCVSWRRNSNRVCDGNIAGVCSTKSRWRVTQTVELGSFFSLVLLWQRVFSLLGFIRFTDILDFFSP